MSPKKKNTPKTTVNVDAVKREVSKLTKEQPKGASTPMGHDYVELDPGSVRRQSPLEQEMGTANYRDMIHSHNEKNKDWLDKLPFTFPKKKVVRSHLNVLIACVECGYQTTGTEHTVGFTCPQCRQYVSAINPEQEKRGYDPDAKAGIFGTANDLLDARERASKKKDRQ